MSPICSDYLDWRSQLFSFGAENSSPKYWFGEFVNFCWVDENTGESHSETGLVVGVAWIHSEREWQYMITWLRSTINPDDHDPILSEELVPEQTLCKV